MNKIFMPIIKTKSERGVEMFFDLKGCPCCGGEADIFRKNFGKTVWVQCTECGLSTSKYDLEPIIDGKNGLEWASSRWNMRCR